MNPYFTWNVLLPYISSSDYIGLTNIKDAEVEEEEEEKVAEEEEEEK